ncbi:Xin actin-binding repeat-containing protein 1 [Collichthys lucidus]|uniref:Xin actin-binding repeat-containing protein 1 n=1 Tax=Collichthys lucidus TaxID=240159 RepID=A0A4U5VIT1_COLLU|nr:Xin actin-binding repeat-containing protein 1 [Collichthys lucidus]
MKNKSEGETTARFRAEATGKKRRDADKFFTKWTLYIRLNVDCRVCKWFWVGISLESSSSSSSSGGSRECPDAVLLCADRGGTKVNAADAFIQYHHIILHSVVMRKKERGLCSQTLHILCQSCDAGEVFLVVTGNRRCLTSVRYQTTVEVNTSIQEMSGSDIEAKQNRVLKEITPSSLESKETPLDDLLWRNNERELSRAKTNLNRSKSMGTLQNSAGSIESLKALFEANGATQTKARRGFRDVRFPSTYKAADIKPEMNAEFKEVKKPAEKPKTQIPSDALVNDVKDEPRDSKDEKRRSFADFRDSSFIQTREKLGGSVKALSALYLSKVAPQESTHSHLKPAQDQSSESGRRAKLTKDSVMRTLLCCSKMDENIQQRKDDLQPPPSTRHQPEQEDISGAHLQQSMPSQLSKLYQQRQKCELKRLLKHTHPELKMLDDVVDEELAEVLSSESGVTTGETGYEGEVLSRRLIFENCASSDKVSSYTPKRHMAEGTVERGDVSKTSAVFEEHEGRPCSVKGILEDDKMLSYSPDHTRGCEEEMAKIDVQATRKMFESQSVNTSRPNPDNTFHGKVSISGDEKGAVQKRKQESGKENPHSDNKSNAYTKSLDLTDQPPKQGSCVHVIGQSTDHKFSDWEEVSTGETVFEDQPTSLLDPEEMWEIIKTSASLSKNNPFIPTNIEREHSFVQTSKSQSPAGDIGEAQDYPIANVKNRTHLFESMPFDKIRHQNKDEVEAMVENIKDTLNSLHHVNAIRSGGLIIEVNETMIAKKAKFTLSEDGPEIKYDEVAEGGAQNFIVQLLPRANLKPQLIYLKEDSKGSMEAMVVNVPVHQHHFTSNQDTEFKTANVVQVVEDILNQDNSLRKGVIIQEDVDRCAEVIVYSLYNYFDEEDVKSYCPPQGTEYDEPQPERCDVSKTSSQELRKGAIESTISCLRETSKDHIFQGSIRPEITEIGNVKLFKSCIEKGDLEYLKTLQAESTAQEQELSPNQNVAGQGVELHHDQTEESTSEWIPVDVKKLKNMFSGDQRPIQPKQNVWENLASFTTISCTSSDQNVPKSQSSTECNVGIYSHGQIKDTLRECGAQTHEEASNSTVTPQGLKLLHETQDGGEIPEKGNVKLFKSCIEKGDLEYLKTLQAEPTVQEQELSPNQNVAGQGAEESTSEWIPVDVKKLKNMFSGDQRPIQPKQNVWENRIPSTTISCTSTDQNVPKSQSSTECNVGIYSHGQIKDTPRECGAQTHEEASNSAVAPQGLNLFLEIQDDGKITEKGNVKLFKSCIEKGDLEYLKTLQAEPTAQEQEHSPNQNVAGQGIELHHDQTEESTSEWIPVDVKKLKNMFSGDQRPIQPKQNVWENLVPSTTISCTSHRSKCAKEPVVHRMQCRGILPWANKGYP